MPDQVKPDQKIRLLPELWAEIDKQTEIEGRKSRANMVEQLIKRGLDHQDSAYFRNKTIASTVSEVIKESKAKFGSISYDPKKIKL